MVVKGDYSTTSGPWNLYTEELLKLHFNEVENYIPCIYCPLTVLNYDIFMTVFRYNFVLIMYFCVHAMVLLYRTWCIHSDLHISTWLMWFLSIVYIEIHSDAIAIFFMIVHEVCPILTAFIVWQYILISVNITFCCDWHDLGKNILFYYDFLTAVF